VHTCALRFPYRLAVAAKKRDVFNRYPSSISVLFTFPDSRVQIAVLHKALAPLTFEVEWDFGDFLLDHDCFEKIAVCGRLPLESKRSRNRMNCGLTPY
jgi:hypothetical protein